MSYIMAINAGSSSLKYQIFDTEKNDFIIGGLVEEIGSPNSFMNQKLPDGTKIPRTVFMKNHKDALSVVMEMLKEANIDLSKITAVGHRVVMGGEKFKQSTIITDEVIKTIDELSSVAPLHNPANLMGINAARELFPNATQVAVFDTAFFANIPRHAYRYGVPNEWYEKYGVRRYGFHGTSHDYVSKRAAEMLGKPLSELNLISLHIGSGASATAIKNGVAVDTSLGMTPLSGLSMATRCGDIDPGIILFMMEKLNIDYKQMQKILNKESGHYGVACGTTDRRDLLSSRDTNDNFKLALDIEEYNVKKYIGAYIAVLGRVDAIIFTAGVGENNPILRAEMLDGLDTAFGIKLDTEKNNAALAFRGAPESIISSADSKIPVLMIPTNEELMIINDTKRLS